MSAVEPLFLQVVTKNTVHSKTTALSRNPLWPTEEKLYEYERLLFQQTTLNPWPPGRYHGIHLAVNTGEEELRMKNELGFFNFVATSLLFSILKVGLWWRHWNKKWEQKSFSIMVHRERESSHECGRSHQFIRLFVNQLDLIIVGSKTFCEKFNSLTKPLFPLIVKLPRLMS